MAQLDTDDTIAAIASPPGAAQRGIVRISGPSAVECLSGCFVANDQRCLNSQQSVDTIDGVLQLPGELALPGTLLIWPTNRSYTRQPSAEFHTTGSGPLLQLGLKTICNAGARVARAGEFTLRAFLSGRLDLTQAEAVLAVIDAEGQDDLRLSLTQLAGGLATPLTAIRDDLIAILAELEAQLDFADEDIEFISDDHLKGRLSVASDKLSEILDQIDRRHVAEEVFTVALTGLPNAGKSSLFNRLLGESKAIVTNVAGTTTDYITGKLEQAGMTIELIDTAGVEDVGSDELDCSVASSIQASAQQHRRERISQANLTIHCLPAVGSQDSVDQLSLHHASLNRMIVLTHCDQPMATPIEQTINDLMGCGTHVIHTSSQTGQGIDQLQQSLFQQAVESRTSDSPVVSSTILRTSESLAAAAKSVQLASRAAEEGIGEELVASEIRQALDHLGCVVGTIYTDDILDVVFGQFCIGK